jgi:signal transduction histidine kinase
MMLVIAVLIFIGELFSHLFLQSNQLLSLSPYGAAMLDSTILLIILSPAYFGLYRPFWLERQRAEEEVRRLSRQLIHAEEETRAKLVRDLHDEFGQGLTSLQFGLETLRSSLTDKQQKEAALCVRLSSLVAQVGTNVRNIMTELRPSVLETLGLVEALRWSVRHFSEKFSDIRVDLQLNEGGRLAPEIEIALYRVCQEALNNVAKHAMARQVRISLVRTLTMLTLTIEDDGKGFAAIPCHDSATDPQGYGILGMRERIAGVGGDFSINSSPAKGTTVRVQLPLNSEV